MRKYLDTSNLVTYQSGKYQGKYDWSNNIGKELYYSERFIYSILKQANIKFKPQKEFEWLHNRFYDTYLPDYNAIIEIHGKQHYEPTKLNCKGKTPEEIYLDAVEADKIKYDVAILNGLNYYIINASNPKALFEEAKKSLTFIDFTSISELECEKFANYKSIRKECDLWNQGCSIEEIHNKLGTPSQQVQQKLRLGNKYGICNYSKELNMHYHKITNPNRAS